jgi:L-alanine-DL-glutamate epimerase-like enolase superfamily enzyme
LWDIKAKAANMPLYQLLGGASRIGVLVYGHANGRDIDHTVDEVLRYRELGYRAIRAQSGVPGLHKVYGVSRDSMFYEPADASLPSEHDWSTEKYIRTTVVHAGGITHLRRIADFASLYQVRTGCHGATDLSPVCMGAALHFDTAIPNFGIQEYMHHTAETDAVFPHAYTFKDGFLHPGETIGHGVSFDEDLAQKYPYQRAYLPVNRLAHDGTLWNW